MSFDLHIVDADTLILLSIDDMDRLGIYLQNLDNVLVHRNSGKKANIVRLDAHPYLHWNFLIFSHFTYAKLWRLHRQFGHPHDHQLANVLKRAEISTVTTDTKSMLEKIERSFALFQEYAQHPRHFRFTLRNDVDFKQNIYIDILYIDEKTIRHIVNKATRFQAAHWLTNV